MKQGIPKVALPATHAPHKPFKPVAHPHQDRLEQHRELPSLVTDRFKNPIKKGEKA
jgi:hypothetical protein